MEAKTLNGTTLAYIGDAVFSLQVREHLVELGNQIPKKLQTLSVEYVSAKAQASFLKEFLDDGVLSADEIDMVKRGRNSKSGSIAKNTDVITYRNATGFESLWGYLYLEGNTERLNELFNKILKKGN